MIKARQLLRSKKFMLFFGLALALLEGVGVFAYLYSSNKTDSAGEVSKFSTCDDESFRVMVVDEGIIYSANTQSLRPVVDNIKAAGSYESSPNCMFLLTMFAINTGDAKSAAEYHALLAKSHSSRAGYTGTLMNVNLQTPEELMPVIEFMSKNKTSGGQAFEWDGKQPE